MIMTEGQLGVMSAKTAVSLIRCCPDDVVCVLDSAAAAAGTSLERAVGVGAGIPIVRDVADGLAHRPTQLVIGIAPVGGKLPATWRATILRAIEAGLDIVSGLHHLLNDDADLVRAACACGTCACRRRISASPRIACATCASAARAGRRRLLPRQDGDVARDRPRSARARLRQRIRRHRADRRS